MWRELQQLKTHRACEAQRTLQARRLEQAVARRALEAAAQALAAHRRLADEHERSLYAELMRGLVRLRDIEDVQHAVAWSRRTETTLATREQEAGRTAQERDRAASAAQAAQQAAARVQEKFDQLVRQHDLDEARAAERAEDLELDELASLRRDREDWDGGEGEAS